ncbi:MAG: hypothetical protein KIT31_14920 [Deltaproteobacteria bacterium]|nr:hypothetical protein [Deltaproteobacteria bacterium]
MVSVTGTSAATYTPSVPGPRSLRSASPPSAAPRSYKASSEKSIPPPSSIAGRRGGGASAAAEVAAAATATGTNARTRRSFDMAAAGQQALRHALRVGFANAALAPRERAATPLRHARPAVRPTLLSWCK